MVEQYTYFYSFIPLTVIECVLQRLSTTYKYLYKIMKRKIQVKFYKVFKWIFATFLLPCYTKSSARRCFTGVTIPRPLALDTAELGPASSSQMLIFQLTTRRQTLRLGDVGCPSSGTQYHHNARISRFNKTELEQYVATITGNGNRQYRQYTDSYQTIR